MSIQRHILNLYYKSEDVRQLMEVTDPGLVRVIRKKLRWYGHVQRMVPGKSLGGEEQVAPGPV